LKDAKRVKLGNTAMQMERPQERVTQRYNGLRPNYQGKRISIADYPDPTNYGWKFTGSVSSSHVEFFEKKMNDGSLVKLDFYYTTGTIKTVLDHPSRGKNQLFRAQVPPGVYKAVLENPRVHTDQGYRRREDRVEGVVLEETNEEDEFDRMPKENSFFTDGNGSDDAIMENDNDGGKEEEEVSNETKFFARDVNYNFHVQGHANRQREMNRLQSSGEYMEWKEANKKEYAVIHAKFYVSIPKRMYRSTPNVGIGGKRGGKHTEPLPVPQQAAVIDVKASENCTLGTDYRTTGPPQTFSRSNVRMERINGLTDEKEWKGDAVFETKLYYRAEDVLNGTGAAAADPSDEEMSDDEEGTDDVSAAALAEYKREKMEQVQQYRCDLRSVADEEEAEQLLRNARNKIFLSSSISDVDESVNLFYQDLIHRQFLDSDNYVI
jgi:hypothetical protein